MADEGSSQDRTHEPTEKRRQDFRDRGQVPRSREISSAAILAIGGTAVLVWCGEAGRGMAEVFHACFQRIPDRDLDLAGLQDLGGAVLVGVAWMLAVPLGATWAGLAVVEGIQGRGAIPKEPFKLEWERLDPLTHGKRMFLSSQPLVEAAKGVGKLALVAGLVWLALRDRIGTLPALVYATPAEVLRVFREMAFLLLSRALPVALAIAVLDYLYQWYRNNEEMRMTRQEVKDEHRQSDGDPHVKAARRQRMRQVAMQRSVLDVARADVVITNPTHFAVALRYRREESPAPVIVAKGVDHLAERIKAEAARHDIPRVENRSLARALHARGKVGQPIPEELYGAVARVLAVLWRRRRGRPPGA